MKLVAIIPARKGSKRLIDKNIRVICNKPMVAYAIEEAIKSKCLDKVVVSTDDSRVVKIAGEYDVEVVIRPDDLAQDITPQLLVVEHVKESLGVQSYDVVLLQPTSPLRTVEDIDKGIEIYLTGKFSSVVSVKKIGASTFYPNGAVYVFKDKIRTDNMGMFLMPEDKSVDVDTEFDFNCAKMVMEHKKEARL